MSWKIAQAKQHLSDLVRRAEHEPQVITNRDRTVAAVVGVAEFQLFLKWKAEQTRGSMSQALSEGRRICVEEGYELVVPPRVDRENPLLKKSPSRAPARHKRHQ